MTDRCAIHGHEPVPPRYHLLCGECGHVFVSALDLLVAHNDRCAEVGAPGAVTADDVAVCPLCTHDL